MIVAVGLPSAAYAWGPEASEMITLSALQAIRRDFPDALARSEDALVEGGTLPAYLIMDKYVGAGIEEDPAVAVAREINVLRDAARLHFTDYVAYRFGVVGRIAAEIMMPFGIPRDNMERAMKGSLEKDIEQMLHKLRYEYQQRRSVHSPTTYFADRTRFMDNALKYIADDYEKGIGYAGYARRAVPTYYTAAITAVADVWFTILEDVKLKQISKRQYVPRPLETISLYSSNDLLVDYFVDATIYFIGKNDGELVEQSYAFFLRFNQNPARAEPYERLGDAFLAAGYGPRAVIEYRKGWRIDPAATEIRDKIVRYYLITGQKQFDSRKTRDFDPLTEALATYNALLEIDPSNQLGNEKKNEVERAIAARDQRRRRANELIDVARAVSREAEELEREGQLADSITQYKNAVVLYGKVDEEFEELRNEAEDSSTEIDTKINIIFETVLSNADELIAQAQQRAVEGNWQGAIQLYDRVPETLSLFRNEKFQEEYAEYFQDANKAMQLAEGKKKEAQTAFEDQQAAAGQQPARRAQAPSARPQTPAARPQMPMGGARPQMPMGPGMRGGPPGMPRMPGRR